MRACCFICITGHFLIATVALCQEKKNSLEVHGFVMLDGGYNFNSMDPEWFDVMRPTKLPSVAGQFPNAGNVYFSIRQTRLGFRSSSVTSVGELKTNFDFDLFGFGEDAGQTTFHVINAFAEWKKILVGQTASVFMDTDVVPVTLDYWGPCSRTFNFNIQVRYTVIQNQKHRLLVALERPNAKADGGSYRPQLDLENVDPKFIIPNLVTHYRRMATWGHIQAGGLLRLLKWADLSGAHPYDLTGQDVGWGVNVSALVRTGKILVIKSQAVYGEGAQSYFADAPPDVGLQSNYDDPLRPLEGKALPIYGIYFFTEWRLTSNLSGTIGYATQEVANTDMQDASAFRKGQYALINVRYYPVDRVQVGFEYQFGRRDNFADDLLSTGNKIQLSLKVNFSSRELNR